MDTDPAFAAFAVTTSLGRHQLSWSPVPGVTNYEVSVWAGENLVRSLVTNACSVVITGNLASVICDLHVNCFDEKIGAERSAEASFIQPYIPNLRIKKVAAPFEYTPTSPLQGGELLFDQEYVVTQDSQWPKQYFLNSFYWEYCDYGLYMSGMWCEVLDENGVPYPTEWTTCGDRILVPSGTHTLRVRLFGSDAASMSECGNHPQLIEPIYLVEWSPSIVFSSAPTVETEEGSVVVVFTREEDVNQPGADFLIDYSGCPSGAFDPTQYVYPFGSRTLGDYVSTTLGNSGEMSGGSFVFPLGYIGSLQFGAEDDALGAKRICCLRLTVNRFSKYSIKTGNVKGKSFPLTTSSLRSAYANGAYQYGSDSLTENEIGFVAELTGDDPIAKSLVVEPSGPVFWPTRSSALVATAQSAFSVVSPDAVMALSSATFSDDCEHPSTNLTFQGSVIGSCDGPCDDDQDEPCDDDDCYEDYPKPDDDDDCGCNNSDTDGPSGRSVAFRLSLGKTGANTVAGMVWFEVEGDSVGVCPGLFSILTNNSVAVSQTENSGVLIECSQTGGRSVLISPEGEGQVRLLIHEFLDTGWAPVGQCWVIANEGDTQHVRFRKYLGGESIEANLREDVLFSYDNANALWAKVDAMDGNAYETVKHEGDLATDGWTKTTRLHSTGAGNTLRLSGAISSNALVGAVGYEVPRQVMSAEWDGLSQTWLETFMSYWAAAGNTKVNGKPKFRRSPYNGEWKYWAYDSFGRETFTAEPLNGAGAPTELVAGEEEADLTAFAGQPGLEAKVTESLYEGAETGSFLDFEKPRTVVGYVIIQAQTAPVMVSCAWHTYARELSIDNYSLLRHRVIRAASASAEKDAPGNTWTETLAYADEIDSTDPLAPEVLRGRMLREEGSDGTLTTWSYASGTYGNEAAFTIVSRRGTTTLCNGVANKSTYEVEVVDAAFGRTLRRETRLYTGGTPDQDPVLSWETRVYDEKGRLVTTSYSDGTSDHNEWGCCKIESSVGRDGSSRSFSYDPNGHRTVTFDEAIGQLPGTEGSYPFTEICTDALGRETNSVRAVTGGTMAFLPLVTQTEYPNGTGRFRVTTDPIGGQSVSLRYYLNDGAEVSDTIASGVTNRIVRKAGGETVEKKIWVDPVTGTEKWTQKTRSTTWLADGRRVEAVVFAASDRAPYEKSVTVYDFLGQVVSETTPLFEVANTYANGRLIRTDRSNGPTILYTYDSLGNRVDTSTDADENGSVNYDGTDPITRTLEGYEVRDGQVWHVTSNLVWNAYGQNVCLPTSVSRDRLTGLGTVGSGAPAGASLMTAQSETEDWRGNITRTTTYANPSTRTQWKVTDTPESAIDAVVQSVAGRPVQLLSSTGIDSAYAYDGFGRQIAFIDGRSNGHATFYNDVGLVSVTGTFPYTAPLSEYFNPGSPLLLSRMAFAYDGLGRRISSTNALEQVTQMAYDPLGNVIAQWGATYPVVYEYDTAGRKVAMATTRDTNQSSGNLLNLLPAGVALSDTAHTAYPVALDTTRWTYQPSTGLLVSKIYADGTGPTYTYTDEGRLATRTWARGVVTTYGYNTLGQLVAVDYSDATPDVSYTYDRLGRQLSAVSSVSAVSYSYSGFDLISESQNGVTLSSNHDSLGRVETMNYSPQGLYYGYYEELRVYDDYGRLSSINVHSPYNTALSGTTPYDSSFDYAYLAGTDTPQSMTAWHWSEYLDENENWVPQVSQTLAWSRSYESARDLMTGVENSFGGQPVSTFTYVNDALGRRMQRTDFDGSVYKANSFAYNQRSEVTLAHMDNTFYNYGYDPIGNRCFALANGEATAYTANAVNQYTAITGGSPSSPNYDADGNMLTCALQTGEWHFFWDGENRLITASNATTMVRNAYDHQSRRIRKEVSAFNASTSNFEPVTSHFFLWDGWNPLCESVTPATASMNPADVFSYTWGLDLAGSKQGAGGVGGLLAEYAPSVEWIGFGEVYYPAYDANGNVTTYLDAIGTSAGRFEYDAFGSTISGNVDAGLHLPFRFSTKYAGEETGMCNYGYRFYHPGLSRWVSRDPIGERGGNNLFGFVNNNSVNNVDDLGLVVTDNVTKHGGVPRDKFNELYKQYSLRVAPRNVVGACKAYILASFLPKGAGCDASCSQIVVRHDTSVEGGVFWLEGEDVSTENHEMRHVQHALDSADAFDKLLHLFEGKCVKDKCARARGRYLEASLKFVTAVQENNDNRLEFEDYGNEYPDTGADYGDSYRELASAREVFEDAKTKMKEACK